MPAANVSLVIDRGEDWAAQILWTNELNEPVTTITDPVKLHIVRNNLQIALTIESTDDPPDDEIPEVVLLPELGLIQLHIPRVKTATLYPGSYRYDMFVSVDDGEAYAGEQQIRLLSGRVTVNQRITVM